MRPLATETVAGVRQQPKVRDDFAEIHDELTSLREQLTRLPTRGEVR